MQRSISLTQATAMGVNIMIGAGVLTGPAIMTLGAGSVSFLGWLFAAIILLPIVFNIARLPEAMPGHGGMYLYCKTGLGPIGGFIGGWMYFLVYNIAITCVLSAFYAALKVFFPTILILQSKTIFLALCLLGVFCFNLLSATSIAWIQSSLTFFKLIPIAAAIVLAPFFWKTSTFQINLLDFSNLSKAIPLAMFGFTGFEYCSNISHLVRGGPRAARTAILSGFSFLMVLYTLFHLSLLVIMGQDGLIMFKASGYSSFVMNKFPLIANILAIILPVSTVTTYFNSSNGIMFLDGILLHSLATDGVLRFGSWFGKLSANGRPWTCTLFGVLFSLFTGIVVQDTSNLAKISNVCMALLFIVAIVALLRVGTGKYFSVTKFLEILGLASAVGLLIFNWLQMGDSTTERLLNMLPALVGIVGGIILLNPAGLKPSVTTTEEDEMVLG